MPRPKSSASGALSARSQAVKRRPARAPRPRRVKSVLVDVIEDEPLEETEIIKKTVARTAKKERSYPFKSELAGSLAAINPEIDNQKKFFSELVSEIKSKNVHKTTGAPAEKNRNGARSVGLYRRLVVKFIILVLLLGGVVAYFSFSKLTVTLSLKGEPLSDSLLLKVTDNLVPAAAASTTALALANQTDPREDVPGTIKEISPTVTKTYPATGETYLGEEITGQVRIINNYNKSQALVATTRLVTPDNKLFRIKNAINVPAGGEVTVDIYADKPSENLAIGPMTFTIPGLWLGLQDKIYGKSDAPFTFSRKVRRYVNASDLASATSNISEALLKSAHEEVGPAGGTDSWLYLTAAEPTVTVSAKVNDQKDEFTAQATGKIVAISFSKEAAAKLAAAKLNLVIPDNKELTEFKPENISYSLDNYDSTSRTATIKASFTGTMILKSNADVIDSAQLINLTEQQITTYLKDQPEVKEFSLKFSPTFIKKAPSLVDRINIQVNKD